MFQKHKVTNLQLEGKVNYESNGGSVQGLQWQWERPELPRRPHLIPTTSITHDSL